jgi:nucleotide-binding universal stress UspA family protein
MDDPRIDTAQYGTLDVTMVNEYLTSVAKSTIGSTTKLFESYEDRVSSAIETGDPAPVIADKAREIGADLVVVGSRGHTGIGSLFMGSVSTKIVQIAPCSVMVVR